MVLLVLVAPLAAYRAPILFGMHEAYVVLSGSMEPQISAGDLIFNRKVEPRTLKVGDIITFQYDAGADRTYTHRIIDIRQGASGLEFIMRGDANEDPDPRPVQPDEVRSRFVMLVPDYGHALAFAQTTTGFFVLILTPGLLFLAFQVRTIYQALVEIERRSKAKKAKRAALHVARPEAGARRRAAAAAPARPFPVQGVRRR